MNKLILITLSLLFLTTIGNSQCEIINDNTNPCGEIYTDWYAEPILSWDYDQVLLNADDVLTLKFSDLAINELDIENSAPFMLTYNPQTKLVHRRSIKSICGYCNAHYGANLQSIQIEVDRLTRIVNSMIKQGYTAPNIGK